MSRDNSDKLPAKITLIQPQKNNRDRYSIFIEDGFLIGIDESTLLEHNLKKGVNMTPFIYKKLQQTEGRQVVKSYLLKLLGRRDHARKELFDKAVKKQYSRDITNSVLDELKEKDYINDRSFARKFAKDKSRLNNWGPAKIKSHLLKKGISRNTAQKSVELAFKELDLKNIFFELLKRKRRHLLKEEHLLKRKKKAFDFLSRKGYRSESIHKYLDELLESLDS